MREGIEHSPLMRQFAELLHEIKESDNELAKITPNDRDKKFLKYWEDLTCHLYQLRYMCEEHNESPLARKIEEICINLTSVISGLGVAAGESDE